VLTGYDDLLRKKKIASKRMAVILISLGVMVIIITGMSYVYLTNMTSPGNPTILVEYNYSELGKELLDSVAQPMIYEDVDTELLNAIDGELSINTSSPSSLIIPSINLYSNVTPLIEKYSGNNSTAADLMTYASPAYVVGHLPKSANPGEHGSVWLFGHLESPFLNEGSIFWDLPSIQEKLTLNENVNVVVMSSSHKTIYRVNSVDIIEAGEFEYEDYGKATLHLVTCYPRLEYDKRLVVNAELVITERIN
jgi:LPXTG-site transpeptidase (sortase) family protein